MKFFDELKRRNVFKETLAYLLVSWLILQVASTVLPIVNAPDWVIKTISFILILGLPFWIIFSWTFQITPEGFKKTKHLSENKIHTDKLNKRLNIVIISMLIIVIFVSFYTRSTINGFSKTISVSDQAMENSIAVLPFVNMSNDVEQEYFADGLSEELINMFANLPELRVIGRTSSFAFKGKNEDLRTIAEKLGVNYVLEGSVRKSGNTIRITAQLIKSRDGSHLWSKTYDRNLDDIFEIQDEISAEVTDALKVTILKNYEKGKNEQIDSKAYDYFLKGRYYYETFAIENSTLKALEWFDKAIEKDSLFALAWTYKSMCHWRQSNNSIDAQFKDAKAAAVRAFRIDPSSGIAAVNLGEILDNEYNFKEALKMIDRGLELEPNNPYVLRNAGRFYTIIGRTNEAIDYCKKALENDPIQRTALDYLIAAYYHSEKYPEANELMLKYMDLYPMILYNWKLIYVIVYQNTSDKIIEEVRNKITPSDSQMYMDFLLAVQKKDNKKSLELYNELKNNNPDLLIPIAIYSTVLGDHTNAFNALKQSFLNKDKGLVYINVEPLFKPLRNDSRFQSIVEKMNFPE